MEDMFEDVVTETVRDVPEEYNKPDYYARKTCNYLTAVLQVFHQDVFISMKLIFLGLFLLPVSS